jgi:hypothetical protein
MDPTVTAAAIGVGGTVIVGVAGFGAAIWNTRRTIRAALDVRIWDERAKTYVDTLAAIGFRQEKRDNDTRAIRFDAETERNVEAYFAGHIMPDWWALDARLHAFGSDDVVASVRTCGAAHAAALSAFEAWRESGDEGLAKSEQIAKARALIAAANQADTDAIDLISGQLQGRRKKTPRPRLLRPRTQKSLGKRDSAAV